MNHYEFPQTEGDIRRHYEPGQGTFDSMSEGAGRAEIRLLGSSVWWNGEAAVPLVGKTGELASLLVFERPHWVSRKELIDRLWSGDPTRTASSALRNVISQLRSTLGDDAIESTAKHVRLSSTIGTDVERLARELDEAERCMEASPDGARARLQSIVAALSNDALVGLDLAALQPLRDRINLFRAAAEDHLITAMVATGTSTADIGVMRRLAKEEPFREARVQGLMIALSQRGRRRDALEEFRLFVERLRDGPGLLPGLELCDTERQILESESTVAGTSGLMARPVLISAQVKQRAEASGWKDLHHLDHVEALTNGDPDSVDALLQLAENDPFFDGGTAPKSLQQWFVLVTGPPDCAAFGLLRLIALETESMTTAALAEGAQMSLQALAHVLAPFIASGLLNVRIDSVVSLRNELARLSVVHQSTTAELMKARSTLAGLLELPLVNRLWHSVSLTGLPDDLLEQLAAAIEETFANTQTRSSPNTVRAVAMHLMTNVRGDWNVGVVVRVLAAAATVVELAGDANVARQIRTHAVRLAYQTGDPHTAGQILIGPAVTGRTYRSDMELGVLLDQCVELLKSGTDEELVGRLLAERVCREVLENGVTADIERSMARLETVANTSVDTDVRLSLTRAELYLQLANPSAVIPPMPGDDAIRRANDRQKPDGAADILAIEACSALAAGDCHRWERSLFSYESFSANTQRPGESWATELLWATDLQRRGQLADGASRARDAQAIGVRHGCPDAHIAFRLHRLTSNWHRQAFEQMGEMDDKRDDELGLIFRAIGRSFLVGPDRDEIEAALEFLCRHVRAGRPNLTTLPALALATQICSNIHSVEHASFLFERIGEYAADVVVVGLIPVTNFGPIDRYRALLHVLLGRIPQAKECASRAVSVAQRVRDVGWEAAALADSATIARLARNDTQAKKLEAAEAARRTSLRR